MKKLAEKYHANQTRKGEGNIPYIVHPQAVVQKLLSWGANPDSDIIKVAWGHDLLEDTTVTENEIIAAANENVLDCIKKLTCPDTMSKKSYLACVSECGIRDVLLVKIADRICNSEDFIKLEGKLYAYQYFHSADCIFEALKQFADDEIVKNAINGWNEFEKKVYNDAQHEATRGCLIGGAVGDALGAPIEFFTAANIKKYFGVAVKDYVEFKDGTGAITDDTQMTLFTAEGILRALVRDREKGICAPASVMRFAYLRWLATQDGRVDAPSEFINSGWLIREKRLFVKRAPGMTCISSLENKNGSVRAQNNSKGCGTVMRMAPVGLFFEPEDAYRYGCEFSAITHGHQTGITAGGAFAMLISYLRYGNPLEKSLDLLENHLRRIDDAAETLEFIRKARTAEDISELGDGWVAEEALAIGIFCALKHTWDFEKGVIEAVNIDGDSDSTGAIAGNILGVLNGEKAIPEKWRRTLREYDIVSRIADDLHKKFEKNADGHVSCEWFEKYPGF